MKPLPNFENIANVGSDQPDWLKAMTINGHFVWPHPTSKVRSCSSLRANYMHLLFYMVIF